MIQGSEVRAQQLPTTACMRPAAVVDEDMGYNKQTSGWVGFEERRKVFNTGTSPNILLTVVLTLQSPVYEVDDPMAELPPAGSFCKRLLSVVDSEDEGIHDITDLEPEVDAEMEAPLPAPAFPPTHDDGHGELPAGDEVAPADDAGVHGDGDQVPPSIHPDEDDGDDADDHLGIPVPPAVPRVPMPPSTPPPGWPFSVWPRNLPRPPPPPPPPVPQAEEDHEVDQRVLARVVITTFFEFNVDMNSNDCRFVQ